LAQGLRLTNDYLPPTTNDQLPMTTFCAPYPSTAHSGTLYRLGGVFPKGLYIPFHLSTHRHGGGLFQTVDQHHIPHGGLHHKSGLYLHAAFGETCCTGGGKHSSIYRRNLLRVPHYGIHSLSRTCYSSLHERYF